MCAELIAIKITIQCYKNTRARRLMSEFHNIQMEKVDIFADGFYKKNRLCMMVGGIWPESRPLIRKCLVILVMLTLLSLTVPMWFFMYRVAENLDDILPTIGNHCSIIGILLGNFYFIAPREKIQQMVDHIRQDWAVLEGTTGLEYLPYYAKRGALGTTIYMSLMYSVPVMYPLFLLTEEIMDAISYRNETRVKKLPMDGDYTIYGIKQNEYYYLILTWEFLCTMLFLNQVVAVDTFVIITVEHCCGLFKAVGRILQETRGELLPEQQYRIICKAIMIHNRAITLARTIESNFTIMYGAVLIISTLSWSGTLLQIILKRQRPSECLIYIGAAFGQIIHLLSLSVPGQELFDHSSQVSEEAYDCNWPDLCPGAKKLIATILMRTMKPMAITAGGFYFLNIESLGNMIRTSFSVITLMLSVE